MLFIFVFGCVLFLSILVMCGYCCLCVSICVCCVFVCSLASNWECTLMFYLLFVFILDLCVFLIWLSCVVFVCVRQSASVFMFVHICVFGLYSSF